MTQATWNWNNENVYLHAYSPEGLDLDGYPVGEFDKTFYIETGMLLDVYRDYVVTMYVKDGYTIEKIDGLDFNAYPYDFKIESDKKSAISKNSFALGYYYDGGEVSNIEVTTDVDDTSFDVVGFNYLYKVDNEILSSLNKERFTQTIEENILDSFSDYVINTIELPFKLDDTLLSEMVKITLGKYHSETVAHRIATDTVHVSLGSVEIPTVYNNSLDFLNTSVYIHLPYTDRVELDLNYCIGETLDIEYIISLYDGEVTCNIRSSKIDEVFYSKQFKIGRNIPFTIKEGGVQGDLLSYNNGLNNGILTPIVEVVRNDKFDSGSPYMQDVVDYVTLGDCEGFVKVERVDLMCSATSNERNSIISLLENGVIIR